MATNNRITGSGNENFKQIESDSWSNIYLPAICAGVIMTVVLFVAIACSKKPDNTSSRINSPAQPAVSSPSAPVTAVAPLPEKPKRIKKHRPANATYVSGTYGVSFSYPRKYSLATGSAKSEVPVQSSFLKPGAVEVAAVDMPVDTYPNTDFSSALLNVSVNTGLTVDECAQFVPASNDPAAAKPTTIKLGTNEFTELEQMSGEANRQSDMKYFHLFKNGACYEFALDVETARKADEDLAQVDRGQAFKQLEKVLTTARIKEVKLPGVETTETAAASSSDAKTVDAKSTDASMAKSDDGKSADVKSADRKLSDAKVVDLSASDVQAISAGASATTDGTQAATTATDSSNGNTQAVTPEQK